MKIKVKKGHYVDDGRYLAKVTKIEDYRTKTGADNIRIKFIPYDSEGDFDPVYIFLTEECYEDAVGLQLYDIFDMEIPEVVSTQKMQKAFVGKEVCVEIEVNNLGVNKVYRNIIAILPADEIDEFYGIGDEEHSEFSDSSDDDDIDENDELEDDDESDLEEDEEEGDFEEDDDDEEYLPWGGSKTQSTSRNNQRRGRR